MINLKLDLKKSFKITFETLFSLVDLLLVGISPLKAEFLKPDQDKFYQDVLT